MGNKPLIDVIVPVYNGAKYIPGFAERMARQADGCVRFLFVDDGSEDDTSARLREVQEAGRLPMKIIPRRHAGVGAARNAGLDAAEAEYLAFFDIDDTCAPDYTAAIRKEAEKGGFDVLVFFRKILYDPAEPVPAEEGIESRPVTKTEMLKAVLLEEHIYSTGIYTILVNRAFAAENGLRFAEGYPYYEDGDFEYRALACAERVSRLDRRLYGYIVKHEGSAMARFTPERVRCLELHRNLEKVFDEKDPAFAPVFRQYAVARIFWSVLWQAALVAPDEKSFLHFAEETKAADFMRRLKGYPETKIQTLRRLFLISRRLYYRTVKTLGGKYTLLGKTDAKTLDEAARACPDPGEERV